MREMEGKPKCGLCYAIQEGFTPMHGAGFQGRGEVAKLLLAHGLDPSPRHADGYTPLHRACWGMEARHTETVRILLESGVSPYEHTGDGRMPIDITNNAATKQLLLEWQNKLSKTDMEL